MCQNNLKVRDLLSRFAHRIFSTRTLRLIRFDLIRLRVRLRRYGQKEVVPPQDKLHLGCGDRIVPGWLNVDLEKSDYDLDLSCGQLPWKDKVFDAVVSEQFIEHLELIEEFSPLLRELHRVMKPGSEIWLSCPDIEKICRSYLEHNMVDLLEDRKTRWPRYSLGQIPTQYMINDLFHQQGEHKNLYDFTLLQWALKESGFIDVRRVVESDLLLRFPEFQSRKDDRQSIYVRAVAP